MITKIQAREYLRRFDNMDAGERGEVMTRVGEWLRSKAGMLRRRGEDAAARLQNVVQVSVGWNDAECEAWQEGVRLLSAWGVVLDRGMWPDGIYSDSARSAVRWVVRMLAERAANLGGGTAEHSTPAQKKGGDGIAGQQTKKQGASLAGKPQGANGAGKSLPMIRTVSKVYDAATDTVRVQCEVVPQGSVASVPSASSVGMVPARPKHIDQYVHLLPVKTQERAQEYGPLMRELDEAREKMRLLMEDDHASASQREQWAKRAVALEKKAKGILVELDREWERIVKEGRVKVDALGMAYIEPAPRNGAAPDTAGEGGLNNQSAQSNQNNPSNPMADEPSALRQDGKPSAEDLRKAGLLRKWLIDLRYGNTEGKRRERYLAKWREKYRLMVQLGGKEAVTEKVVAAAKHYGVSLSDLDKEGADA